MAAQQQIEEVQRDNDNVQDVILYFGYVYFLQDKYPIPQVDPQTLTEWGTKIEEMIPDDLGAKFLDSNYTRPKEQPWIGWAFLNM